MVILMISVAEPNHFSSAPAPGKTNPAPTGSYRLRLQTTDFDTKHLKNINFNIKIASVNLDFVPKTEKLAKY